MRKWLVRACPVAEFWADVDLMNRIITACQSTKKREIVDLQRRVESYQLKKLIVKIPTVQEKKKKSKILKDNLPFNYSITSSLRNIKSMKYVRWKIKLFAGHTWHAWVDSWSTATADALIWLLPPKQMVIFLVDHAYAFRVLNSYHLGRRIQHQWQTKTFWILSTWHRAS